MRRLNPSEIVKIWPAKYDDFIYGVFVDKYKHLERYDTYEVFADGINWKLTRQEIFVDEENPVRSSEGYFPNIRRVFPSLIANEIVSIQPMTMPKGVEFFLDYQFKKDKTEDSDDVLKD